MGWEEEKKEDVFVIKEDTNIKIKQTIDKDIYTEATIDTKNATASIKIHDGVKGKDYECVKIIIDNKETDIDQKLLQILKHPKYNINNSFMFTIIKSDEKDFDPNNSETYSIIYSFNNFININFERYDEFYSYYSSSSKPLPKISSDELIYYDNMIKK